jgi:hypothetical protein
VTVRRGQAWGVVGPPPAGVVRATSDAEAARIVEEARSAATSPPPVRLVGGDLWRTCGGREDRGDDSVAVLSVDIGVVALDGGERVFVAHAIARGRSWWFGPVLAVCNAQYLGQWDVAPRSHPGDGHLDLLELASMPLRERWQARQRLVTGTHVPHPAIAQRRVASTTITFARPRHVWLDGVRAGRAGELSIRAEPGALTICV